MPTPAAANAGTATGNEDDIRVKKPTAVVNVVKNVASPTSLKAA